jgi:hypothetical protein
VAAPKPPAQPPTKPVGGSGTYVGNGIIDTREVLAEFRGASLYRTVDQMVRSDPVARAALLMILLPLQEATYSVQPAGADDVDQEAAELVRRALLEHLDWAQVVWDLANPALRYGHGLVEYHTEAVEWDLTYEGSDGMVEAPRRVYWVPARLAPRLPHSIVRWNTDDQGDLQSVTQQLAVNRASRQVVIDAWRLVVWTNEKEGDNHLGTSMLRSAYRSWYVKEKLEVIDAIRAERAGVGVPVGWDGGLPGEAERLEEVLAGIRANEEGAIVLRGKRGGDDSQEIEMLDMRAAGTADVQASLHYHVTQILWCVLGAWQQLGQGEVGARATATVQDDPFYLLLSALAKRLVGVFNRQLIPQVVGWNFATDRMPKLAVSDIQGQDFTQVATSVATLIASGAITTDDQLEAHMRDLMGLPPKAMQDAEDIEPEPEPAEPDPEPQDPDDDLDPNADPDMPDEPTEPAATPAAEDDERPVRVGTHKRQVRTRGGPILKDVPEYKRRKPLRQQLRDAVAQVLASELPGIVRDALVGEHQHAALPQVESVLPDGTTFTSWRALTDLERDHVLVQGTARTIEQQRQVYMSRCESAALRLAGYVDGAMRQGAEDVEVPDALVADLRKQLHSVLAETATFGRAAARAEVQSQRGAGARLDTVEDAAMLLADKAPRDPQRLGRWLDDRARTSGKAIIQRLELAASRAASSPTPMPAETLTKRLDDVVRSALRSEAVATVAQAMAAGRHDESRQLFNEGAVDHAVYSAVLDTSTCGPCRELDGEHYDVDTDDYERDYPPLYACDGQDACRCMMVLVASTEVRPER